MSVLRAAREAITIQLRMPAKGFVSMVMVMAQGARKLKLIPYGQYVNLGRIM